MNKNIILKLILLCSLFFDIRIKGALQEDNIPEETINISLEKIKEYIQKVINQELLMRDNQSKSELFKNIGAASLSIGCGLLTMLLGQVADKRYKDYSNACDVIKNLKILYPTTHSITFDSVIGYKEIKNILSRDIKLLQCKEKLNGILFYGPPGNGKTNFVIALGKEAGVPVILVDVNNLIAKPEYLLDNVQTVFKKAKEIGPCILFIDEIDLLLKNRERVRLSDNQEKILSIFLQRLDGLYNDENKGILVVGCTNNIDYIDSAIHRHGRLGKKIFIDCPTENDIEELFEKKCIHYLVFKDLFSRKGMYKKIHQHKMPVVTILEYIKGLNEEINQHGKDEEAIQRDNNENEYKLESIVINLNKEFGIY